MIEELTHWEIENSRLLRLGKKIEEANKEFALVDMSLSHGPYGSTVNMGRARSLMKKVNYLLQESEKISLNKSRTNHARFDSLALKDFQNNLFTQKEYLEFFFTKKYNKQWGVNSFMNYVFLPRSQFEGKPLSNGAVGHLEERIKNINYNQITKRENLMCDILDYQLSLNIGEAEEMLLQQIPYLKKIISEYNQDLEFITSDHKEAEELIDELKDNENLKKKVKSFFGKYKGDITEAIINGIDKRGQQLSKRIDYNDIKKELIYDVILDSEEYCSCVPETKTIGISKFTFNIYKEPKTGKVKCYLGDAIKSIGHENFHRLQHYLSRNMPAGLSWKNGTYNLSSTMVMEGFATVLENNFMEWVSDNAQRYNISKRDLKIAGLLNEDYFGNKVARLLHSIYHREESPLEKDTDLGAHKKLAKISKVPLYADSDYLNDESLPEIYYFAHYIFGEKYAKDIIGSLEKYETEKHGTLRKAKNFLKKNEKLVIQGLLTGNFGWETKKDFVLRHFWPKARKYCE